MKSIFKIKQWLNLSFFFLIVSTSVMQAQQTMPTCTYTIKNELQVSDRILEFDVYLLNTNPSAKFEASGVQLCITMNPTIVNGGTITPSIVSGSSEMVSSQVPTAFQIDNTNSTGIPMLKVAVTASNFGSSTVISTTAPGTRVCRFRLTNSVAFASANANLQHRLSLPVYRSLLSYWDQGSDGLGTASTDPAKGGYLNLPLTISNAFSATADPVLNTVATVTTDAVNASTNIATGTISDLGSPYATDYGFVYSSVHATPTVSDVHASKGAATVAGEYSASLTGLTGGTTYYVRAYAINSAGTTYGGVVSFTAADLKPKSLSYTTPNVFTKGVAITALSPTVTGAVTGYSISAALPTGLLFNLTTGVISGTPTVVSPATDYTITATNTEGNTQATVRLSVNDVVPSSLNYTTPNVFTKGVAITALTPTVSGGAVTGYSISPSLPSGLIIDALTGVISGTPSVASVLTTYTISAANSGGAATKNVDITVKDIAPTGLSYTTPNVFIKGTAITALSPTVSGGTVTGYSISPSLPSGLTIDASTGVISGNPSVESAATIYTVTATNSGGTASTTLSIRVQDAARQLSIKLLLEGLWNNTNSRMNQCMTSDGVTPQFSAASDAISIELHDATSYSTIVYTASNLLADPDGTIHSSGKNYVDISGDYKGSYYITVKTRNHIQTTSASPVSFSNENVVFDFTTSVGNAFGSNQMIPKAGTYGIYAGDVNQDGIIDNQDIVKLQAKVKVFAPGYLSEDLNGDGIVDNMDKILLQQNTKKFIYVKEP